MFFCPKMVSVKYIPSLLVSLVAHDSSPFPILVSSLVKKQEQVTLARISNKRISSKIDLLFQIRRLYLKGRKVISRNGFLDQGLLNQMDHTLRAFAKFESSNLGLILGTQITPRGWIFWTIIFHHQKIQVKIYLMRGQT